MDLKQLEYILAIEEYGNISKAANALFISQSALNQQLIRLERELGMKLFYRDKRCLRPTQAGRIYLDNAKEIITIKKNTYSLLHDLEDSATGELRLGLTWEHGGDMFTEILPVFLKKHPKFSIKMFERSVAQQHQMILSDHLDLGCVMIQESDRIDANYIPIFREEILLAVPRSHPLANLASPMGKPLTYISLALFKEDLFSLIYQGSTMRTIVDQLFRNAGYQPKILFETSMNSILFKMVSQELCCAVFPQSYACPTDKMVCFRLEGAAYWDVCLVYPKGIRPGNACKDLIQLARQYGYEKEQRFKNM